MVKRMLSMHCSYTEALLYGRGTSLQVASGDGVTMGEDEVVKKTETSEMHSE